MTDTLRRALEGACITDAAALVAELLLQGDDSRGPRWRALRTSEIVRHLDDHLVSVCQDLTRTDDESGVLEAAHVAARALMLLQRAIDVAGDE